MHNLLFWFFLVVVIVRVLFFPCYFVVVIVVGVGADVVFNFELFFFPATVLLFLYSFVIL